MKQLSVVVSDEQRKSDGILQVSYYGRVSAKLNKQVPEINQKLYCRNAFTGGMCHLQQSRINRSEFISVLF